MDIENQGRNRLSQDDLSEIHMPLLVVQVQYTLSIIVQVVTELKFCCQLLIFV